MILTNIESTQVVYFNDDKSVLQYQFKFDGINQEFSCSLNHLPKELQIEFKEWVNKVNTFVKDNVELNVSVD